MLRMATYTYRWCIVQINPMKVLIIRTHRNDIDPVIKGFCSVLPICFTGANFISRRALQSKYAVFI